MDGCTVFTGDRLGNRNVTGEAGITDTAAVGAFKEEYLQKKWCRKFCELHDADETSLYWKVMTQEHCQLQERLKSAKKQISVLLYSNAEDSYKIKPVCVDNAKQLRALHNYMDHLPVSWISNTKKHGLLEI